MVKKRNFQSLVAGLGLPKRELFIRDPFILFGYRYAKKNLARLELRQNSDMVRKIADDLSNLEGRVLEMIFREKIFFIMQLDMTRS